MDEVKCPERTDITFPDMFEEISNALQDHFMAGK